MEARCLDADERRRTDVDCRAARPVPTFDKGRSPTISRWYD